MIQSENEIKELDRRPMKLIKPFLGWTLTIFVALCVFATDATAQKKDAKARAEATRTAADATKALNELMRVPDESIPQSLLKNAKAIAVFPGVIKAAFIVGGRGGKGLISRRIKGGWGCSGAIQDRWRKCRIPDRRVIDGRRNVIHVRRQSEKLTRGSI